MRNLKFLTALLVCLAVPQAAKAAVLTFTDRVSFNAAAPAGLVLEDFETANVAPGGIVGIGSLLDASTSDGVFATGDIAVGLAISVPSNLAAIRDRRHWLTAAVMNDFSGELLTATFTLGNTIAVGMDMFSTFLESGPQVLTLYDSADNALWSGEVIPVGTGVFAGFISDTPIARVTLDTGFGYYGFDNIAFGAAAEIPEPATLALTALAFAALAGKRLLKP
jgi:hypothetical protein